MLTTFTVQVPAKISNHYVSQMELNDSQKGFDLNEEDMHKFHIWPLGIIPYYIDDFSFDKVLRDRIRIELEFINKMTGVRFMEMPRPPDDDESRWVFFLNRKSLQECADLAFKNFTNEGVQRVVVGYDCLSEESLAGIVLAIVGVPPQHNAPNRDKFIKIHTENILPDKLYLFDTMKNDEWLFHDMDYDIQSAGHYSTHQYTSNGAATITILQTNAIPPTFQINGRNNLSSMDIKKIKSLYKYISRQRESNDVPGCDKLFQPGSNISKFEPLPDNEKPLKKPIEYTGGTESKDKEYEEKDQLNKGDVSQEKNVSNTTENDLITDSTAKKNVPIKKNIKKGTQKGESEEDISTSNDDEVITLSREKQTLSHSGKKKNSILDRSDYQTGEE